MNFKKASRVFLSVVFGSALLISLNGCEGLLFESVVQAQETPKNRELEVLVVNRPLTYKRLHQLESGYEYELLQNFAADVGYKLKIKVVRNESLILKELRAGRAAIGAARFNELSALHSQLLRSPVYDEEKTALICHPDLEVRWNEKDKIHPKSKWRLSLNSEATNPSWTTYFRHLAPKLKISSRMNNSYFILRSLEQRKADCTILDRLEAHYYLKNFPTLKIVGDVSPAQDYFFLISNSYPELALEFRGWIAKAARRHILSQAKSRARDLAQPLTNQDLKRFLKDREVVLPRYSSIFRKHGKAFGVPWQVAAAVAYQESKWNPEAQSYTGVKGFMQLTQETAEHLGVEDRTDTEQSIWGGVKYLKMLIRRQPASLPFREKLALALATYNVGPAHMIDAQNLALKLGKNPHLWRDLKEVLPLLENRDYFHELKYGPARGREPVDYVQRVFAYLDLITVQI